MAATTLPVVTTVEQGVLPKRDSVESFELVFWYTYKINKIKGSLRRGDETK